MNKVIVSAPAIIAVAVAGCCEQPATTNEITAEEHTFDTFATALETQGMALFSGVMSHDPNMVCFGFGPGERLVGCEVLETAIRNQMDV